MMQYHMSWNEVFDRLEKILALKTLEVKAADPDRQFGRFGFRVFGIPKGGMIVAGFASRHGWENVSDPHDADLFLDDLIDSGRTRSHWMKSFPNVPFTALVDKRTEPLGWIIFPWETDWGTSKASDTASIEDAIVRQIQFVGEDPNREGLKETPARVARSWKELCSGYGQDPKGVLKTFTDVSCSEIVLLKDIETYSMCEHHLLPFFGKAHVAYIPNGKVVGISKLARLVEIYARRLQIQERICEQVTSTLMETLNPLGAACVIEAKHLCMTARGIQKQNSVMRTSSLKGVFLEKPEARAELMTLIRG